MKEQKKSQAAIEFLATYGWAFLIILIVIGALSYFGILSPSKLLPDRCNFGSEFGCVDYSIGSAGFLVKLRNSLGTSIYVDSLSVSTEKSQLSCSSSIVGILWEKGKVKTIPIACNFANSDIVQGDKGKLNVKMAYHDAKSSASFGKEVQGEVYSSVKSTSGFTVGASCKEALNDGVTISGTYTINPGTGDISVYCDMTSDGGGWTRVAFEDFETPTSGWSNTNTISSCGSYGNILGGYNVISTADNAKTYTFLSIPHTQARLSLDYIKIDSWDSEQAVVRFGGNEIFRSTYCFCSQGCQNSGGTCGGDAICGGGWNEERKIPVTGIIAHTGNTIEVYGDSTIDQGPLDESWGLDNIQVFVR